MKITTEQGERERNREREREQPVMLCYSYLPSAPDAMGEGERETHTGKDTHESAMRSARVRTVVVGVAFHSTRHRRRSLGTKTVWSVQSEERSASGR